MPAVVPVTAQNFSEFLSLGMAIDDSPVATIGRAVTTCREVDGAPCFWIRFLSDSDGSLLGNAMGN
jgi:hypothetical protein